MRALSRRKLVAGLLAAPAIIGPAQAAYFQGAVHRTASGNPLLKPTGTPTLDSGNSQNANNLFVVFDTGQGSYAILQDCSPGHLIYPPNTYPTAWNPSELPLVTTLPLYGTGFKHPGGAFSTTMAGFNSFVFNSDLIRDAHNLKDQGAGAALCVEVIFVPHGIPDSGVGQALIGGRTARGFTETDPSGSTRASVCFSLNSVGKPVLWFKTTAAAEAINVDGPDVLALDVYHHLLATFINDSAGSATMRFYVDGAQKATSSGHALMDTFGIENDEGQVMMGSSAHLFASHGDNYLDGHMFMLVYQTRGPGSVEVAARAAAPYARFTA